MTYNIPILFLVFNRPETTKRVLLEIRKIKPTKLYVVADGPRKNNLKDKENCEKVRNLIDELVDWNCIVKKTYRKENLGCRKSVSEGITWFFKNEEMGVILEDDTLPTSSFFKYSENMLIKYKSDSRIMCISGNTFISDKIRNKYVSGDYFFSKYPHIWGWATWKRAWELYDVNMTGYNKEGSKIIAKYNSSFLEKFYWKRIFNLTSNNKIDTWDYQWLYTIWKNNGLSIQPKYNLVENIGFGKDATHTLKGFIQNINSFDIKKEPDTSTSIKEIDNYISVNHYNISWFSFILKFLKKIF